jgi:TolB-like protein/Tfp pilus assembly protein PilF
VGSENPPREVHDCALFIPVISANTASRHEGYFRLEWDLADQRTHMLARNRAFIVPVCLDSTADAAADVPESFQRVQWTRLPGGETPPEFVRRIEQLLSGEVRPSPAAARGPVGLASGRSARRARFVVAVGIAAAAAYLLVEKPWGARPPPPAAFAPPAHSIAVLPFVNLSGDPGQEYFSDGLTEELLNSLAGIDDLQVAARTSAFAFKGTNTDIGTIARKLNVGAVLEGSVRRSANTIRITAELINAATGFHLWSKTYDRDLGDVLKLQTEIAAAVASALKVTLLGDLAAKVELGGTRNPAAFDAYLRGAKAFSSVREATKDLPGAIAAYTEAIRLDPHYALAFAGRSIALTTFAGEGDTVAAAHEGYAKAQGDAREALAPGSADVLRRSGTFAAYMGHVDTAISAARRAIMLDPLARASHSLLGRALYVARRYEEAAGAFAEAVSVAPDFRATYAERGLAFFGLGDLERARASCETKPDYWFSQPCLAVIYDKLGRHADAEAAFSKLTATVGDAAAYQYATIYAQWGNHAKALEWLETALRQRDGGAIYLKTDPLLDPLRQEPRFQAVMRELKFPD